MNRTEFQMPGENSERGGCANTPVPLALMIPQHTLRPACTRCRTRLVAANHILKNLVKVPLPTIQLLSRYHVDTPTTTTNTNENTGRSVTISPKSSLAARIRSDQPGYAHIVTISKPRITTRNVYSTDDRSDDGSIAGYSSDISFDGEGYRCDTAFVSCHVFHG